MRRQLSLLTADVEMDMALDLTEAGKISEGNTHPIGPQE